MKPKVVVVAGPTATGKTAYGITLAKERNGEVVSADSRQVYKGIDLLSGKVTKEEMDGVVHHMIDVALPTEEYSVAQYQKEGRQAVADILERGKIPIIVGGTGFYIHALLHDISFPDVPPNPTLRKELERLSLKDLNERLTTLDPLRAENIDTQNKVRLIRAIEIAEAIGATPTQNSTPLYDIEWIILDLPDEILKERIVVRLQDRINAGMIEEGRRLIDSGVSFERMEALGLECRSVARLIRGDIDMATCIDELQRAIWQYVKRQRTWFKKYATK